MANNWLVRRAIANNMIAASCTIALASTIPIYETAVVMNTQNQLCVVPAGSSFQPCQQHVVENLPQLIQVVFDQDGRKTVLYADRKCSVCGQYFFAYPSDAPAPPIALPGASGAPPPYAALPPQGPPPSMLPPQPGMVIQPAGPVRTCLNCHEKSPANAAFCGHCGHKFPLICHGCGKTATDGNEKFCEFCGAAL